MLCISTISSVVSAIGLSPLVKYELTDNIFGLLKYSERSITGALVEGAEAELFWLLLGVEVELALGAEGELFWLLLGVELELVLGVEVALSELQLHRRKAEIRYKIG